MLRILCFLLLCLSVFAHAFEENPRLKDYFNKHQLEGGFVLYDPTKKRYKGYNLAHMSQPFSPASTFKIWNALIALDTKTVPNVNKVFYHYQGEQVLLPSWKSDASLKSAMKISQVPAFKELARKIGRANMQAHLQKLGYGNEAIGSQLDAFWLNGSLRISPMRQVELLYQLATLQLNYPKGYQRDVLDLIKLEHDMYHTLYGKTGLFDGAKPMEGWFVGIFKFKNNFYPFALHINITSPNLINERISIAKQCLEIIFNLDGQLLQTNI